MSRPPGKTVAVYLYPQDIAIVEAADKSSAGVSATLRRIIREWDRQQKEPSMHPPSGEWHTTQGYTADRPRKLVDPVALTRTLGDRVTEVE